MPTTNPQEEQEIIEKDFLSIINRTGHGCTDSPMLHSWLHGTDGIAYECFKLAKLYHIQQLEKAGEEIDKQKLSDAIYEGEFDKNDKLQEIFDGEKATIKVLEYLLPIIAKYKEDLKNETKWKDSR